MSLLVANVPYIEKAGTTGRAPSHTHSHWMTHSFDAAWQCELLHVGRIIDLYFAMKRKTEKARMCPMSR